MSSMNVQMKETLSMEFLEGFKYVLVQVAQPSHYYRTIFHGPTMDVEKYAGMMVPRLAKKIGATAEDLVLALLLLSRLAYNDPVLVLTAETIHKLLYTAIIVAMKTHHDVLCNNKVYAQCASIPLKDFNAMERCFLMAVDFDVHVNIAEFELYCSQLVTLAPFGTSLDSYDANVPAPVALAETASACTQYLDATSRTGSTGYYSPAASVATHLSQHMGLPHSSSTGSLDSMWDAEYHYEAPCGN